MLPCENECGSPTSAHTGAFTEVPCSLSFFLAGPIVLGPFVFESLLLLNSCTLAGLRCGHPGLGDVDCLPKINWREI